MDPQNPFAEILARAQQSQAPQQAPQSVPQQAQQAPAQGGGQPMEEVEDQLNPGQNPDNTKNLTSALQSLENYIRQSDDREEIMTARGIISLLSRLIARDQDKMSAKI